MEKNVMAIPPTSPPKNSRSPNFQAFRILSCSLELSRHTTYHAAFADLVGKIQLHAGLCTQFIVGRRPRLRGSGEARATQNGNSARQVPCGLTSRWVQRERKYPCEAGAATAPWSGSASICWRHPIRAGLVGVPRGAKAPWSMGWVQGRAARKLPSKVSMKASP